MTVTGLWHGYHCCIDFIIGVLHWFTLVFFFEWLKRQILLICMLFHREWIDFGARVVGAGVGRGRAKTGIEHKGIFKQSVMVLALNWLFYGGS